jgi:hypothetical protein
MTMIVKMAMSQMAQLPGTRRHPLTPSQCHSHARRPTAPYSPFCFRSLLSSPMTCSI